MTTSTTTTTKNARETEKINLELFLTAVCGQTVCFSQACAFVTSENVLKKSGIQLFRERLSEKVHVTVPKGIVGGFGCFVLQRNLKKWHWRPQIYVCEC